MQQPPPPSPQAPESESPTAGLVSGNQQNDAIALQALGLLNEQVKARIVHYKGDLETNQELDAVTAQVVQQLKAMQAAVSKEDKAHVSPEEMEDTQIKTMATLLEKIFTKDGRSNFVSNTLKPIGRRVAKLFFESELHAKTKGDKERTIYHPEQGIYYVLQRYKNRLRAEIEGFDYDKPETQAQTLAMLTKLERDMQVAFLSRRSPELNRVMQLFTSVLSEFFQEHLPSRVAQMARVTIRNARSARQANSVAYKVQSDVFPAFRTEWERVLMQQMVHFCTDALMAKIDADEQDFQQETMHFFTDPHIFSATGEVLCDALYDYLCLEGFLDLPINWRIQLARQGAS